MGHGWASDVALSNILERYLFTSLFYIRTHKYGFTIRMHLSPTSKLGYLSFNSGWRVCISCGTNNVGHGFTSQPGHTKDYHDKSDKWHCGHHTPICKK